MSTDATTTVDSAVPVATEPRNVEEAIVQVRIACPYVRKNVQVRSGGGFKAAGIDDYLETLTPEINRVGIVITPINVNVIANDVVEVGKDKNRMFRCQIAVSYRISHATTRTKLEDPVIVLGESTDSMDKAMSKAYAYALKQCLRQVFLVETGEEERGPQQKPREGAHPGYDTAWQALMGCTDIGRLKGLWDRCEKTSFSEDERQSLKKVYDGILARLSSDPAQASANNPTRQQNGQRQRQPSN